VWEVYGSQASTGWRAGQCSRVSAGKSQGLTQEGGCWGAGNGGERQEEWSDVAWTGRGAVVMNDRVCFVSRLDGYKPQGCALLCFCSVVRPSSDWVLICFFSFRFVKILLGLWSLHSCLYSTKERSISVHPSAGWISMLIRAGSDRVCLVPLFVVFSAHIIPPKRFDFFPSFPWCVSGRRDTHHSRFLKTRPYRCVSQKKNLSSRERFSCILDRFSYTPYLVVVTVVISCAMLCYYPFRIDEKRNQGGDKMGCVCCKGIQWHLRERNYCPQQTTIMFEQS
jgi:hypothetical protein